MYIILSVLKESLKVAIFVLLMMVTIDLINLKTKGRLVAILKKGQKWKQYFIASFLGALPGCLGSFAGVSLYIHGMISFGALTGLMFATAGDEQFIMLSMFPGIAILLFGILFILGIVVGFITDWLLKKYKIKTCTDCNVTQYHPGEKGYYHYLKEHIWKHIIKGHLFRVFLWTFGALLIVEYGMTIIDIKSIAAEYTFSLLVISALVGILPESGPHLIFVILFSKGLVPFSVLFTSSVVQDGHGMLPMLSYSIKDTIKIKMINLVFGLVLGTIMYLLGY